MIPLLHICFKCVNHVSLNFVGMKVLQSWTGAGHYLVDSSPSMSISPLAAAAENKFVITGQGATISITVVSFISVRPVREAKQRAVGATALL